MIFLQVVETDVRVQQERAEEARMQQTPRMFLVPYGAAVGPGLFPMTGATAEVIAGTSAALDRA